MSGGILNRNKMALLHIDRLCVKLQNTIVLSGTSLELRDGEVVSLLGDNGSGKTTLLRAISGLVRVESGEIFFKDSRINGWSPHRIVESGIVQVPAGRRLFNTLSVKENLELASRFSRARKVRRSTLNSVFQIFPVLSEKKNDAAGSLSGGEQQMLAIARAMMSVPIVLMLDEPCVGLAADVATEVYASIAHLNKNLGISILLIDHDIYSALTIAARGYVLTGGCVTLSGPAGDILRDLQSDRTEYLCNGFGKTGDRGY